MRPRLIRAGCVFAALIALCAGAQARVNVHVGIGFPGVVYAPPPPVVFARPAPFWPPPVMYSRFGYPVWHGDPRFMGPRHAPHPGWRRHPHRRW